MPALQNRERLRAQAFPDYATKLAFYALRNSALRQKNAQIMLDSQNNTTLVAENALFNFKQNVETQASCVLATEQSEKCSIVCYKTSDTVKTCPMINS